MAKRVRDKEAKTAAILAAAIDEFAMKGYDGAYTKDIAKLAGCSEAMIFHYFGDKLGLYAAAVSEHSWRALDDAERSLLNDLPPEFHDYLLALFRVRRRQTEAPALVPQYDQIARGLMEPEFAEKVFAPIHRARRSAIAEAIRHYQSEGDVDSDVDPDTFAELLGNLVTMTVIVGPRLWGEAEVTIRDASAMAAALFARAAQAAASESHRRRRA